MNFKSFLNSTTSETSMVSALPPLKVINIRVTKAQAKRLTRADETPVAEPKKEPDPMSTRKTHIKQAEVIIVNDLIRTICASEMKDGKKIATYAKPWTDALVLKEIQKTLPHLNLGQIANFRLSVYGEVPHTARSQGNQHTGPKINERMDDVERRLAALEAWARFIDPGSAPKA